MHIERLFTTKMKDVYDSSNFVTQQYETDEGEVKFITVPKDWRVESIQTFSNALFKNKPDKLNPVEENTLPSWMWQRRGIGDNNSAETDARSVFNRIAGSATYAGWKNGFFSDETKALVFYDEIRFMLANRIIALDPHLMNHMGVEWAYGAEKIKTIISTTSTETEATNNFILIKNSTIDEILSGNKTFATKAWNKLLNKNENCDKLTVNFSDTTSEWGSYSLSKEPPHITLDILRLYNEDSCIDASLLLQATRMSVLLLELHYENMTEAFDYSRSIEVGHVNLSALLMKEALLYDSAAGRATAAAICAIMAAEAIATSAELANISSPCPAFSEQREIKLRSLRNQRRAAYGEHNDYERISITPAALDIEAGANLVLVATARRRWDEAIELVQKHGLRHLQHLGLVSRSYLPSFLGCSAQGIEPENNLVRQRMISTDTYKREIHPSVPTALKKMGCDPASIKAIIDHVVGHNTLVAATGINHYKLRKHGLDDSALSRIESYLPNVNNIRFAFTPWTLGERFCHQTLRVPIKQLHDASFDLLKHLGFKDEEISAANAFCCGNRTVLGVYELPPEAEKVFALNDVQQQISMAAAVQSFVSNNAGLVISLPYETKTDVLSDIVLSTWRQGVKTITIYFDNEILRKNDGAKSLATMPRRKLLKRKTTANQVITAGILGRRKTSAMMTSPQHSAKQKATTRSVSIGSRAVKHTSKNVSKNN